MSSFRLGGMGLAVALVLGLSSQSQAQYGRQYYSNWNYHPQRSYHYCTYNYKPTPTYTGYTYHYAIYVPSTPRYVYYYNPHSQQYWGRFDTQGKPGEQYSLLAQSDRKKTLAEIPESAFPKPATMPVIPDAEDQTTIDPPPAPPKP